jgi:putative redox protein
VEVSFKNKRGNLLSGTIDQAENPIAQAIFSHCFTCSKDHAASYRICKALAKKNIQVLRFDFTGLGKSEGEFSLTNFSSNIEDLKSAVSHLTDIDLSPQLLIGHSLGGITAAAAARELTDIQAVATIAAPSRPSHVLEHFKKHIPKIIEQGFDDVTIFNRTFRFTKEYVHDLKGYDERHFIKKLNKPLLVFHSPFDSVVPIDEAATLFMEAKHPKSFISLDHTDHLVSKKDDAEYIAENIASWARRYIKK